MSFSQHRANSISKGAKKQSKSANSTAPTTPVPENEGNNDSEKEQTGPTFDKPPDLNLIQATIPNDFDPKAPPISGLKYDDPSDTNIANEHAEYDSEISDFDLGSPVSPSSDGPPKAQDLAFDQASPGSPCASPTIRARAERYESQSPPASPPFGILESPHLSPRVKAAFPLHMRAAGRGHNYSRSLDAAMNTQLPGSPLMGLASPRWGSRGRSASPRPWDKPSVYLADPALALTLTKEAYERTNASLRRENEYLKIRHNLLAEELPDREVKAGKLKLSERNAHDYDHWEGQGKGDDGDEHHQVPAFQDPTHQCVELIANIMNMHDLVELELHVMHAHTAKILEETHSILRHASAAIRIADRLSDEVLVGRCYYWLGVGHYATKRWGDAIEAFEESTTGTGRYLTAKEIELALEAATESALSGEMTVKVRYLGKQSVGEARRWKAMDRGLEESRNIHQAARSRGRVSPAGSESAESSVVGGSDQKGKELSREEAKTPRAADQQWSRPESRAEHFEPQRWAPPVPNGPIWRDFDLDGADDSRQIHNPIPKKPWAISTVRSTSSIESFKSFDSMNSIKSFKSFGSMNSVPDNTVPLGDELSGLGNDTDLEYESETEGRGQQTRDKSELEDE